MREPAEGTILTVAREMAHQIVSDVAHSAENPRLGPTHGSARAGQSDRRGARARRGERVRSRSSAAPSCSPRCATRAWSTPGGYGLTIIFAGVVAALRGEEPPPLDHHAPARITHPAAQLGTYRFCTNFAVTGHGLSASRFIAPLEQLGDSVLVVGRRDAR